MTRFCNRGIVPSDSRRSDMVSSDSGPVKGARTARVRASGLWRIVISGCLVLCGWSLVLVTDSSALPPGRHYEMVSPVFKGGFGATHIGAVAPDGESVGYFSSGVFGGAPSGGGNKANYLAVRGASAWETAPAGPPASLLDGPETGLSPDLGTEFAIGPKGPSVKCKIIDHESLWLHSTGLPDTDAGWVSVGEVKVAGEELGDENTLLSGYLAASPDFCHILFAGLSEYDRGCGGGSAPGIVAVGVNNQDKAIDAECEVELGVKGYTQFDASAFNAISVDGGEVFFTDCLSGVGYSPADPHQLFVRLGGSKTLEVSRPLEAGSFGGCVGEDGVAGEVPCAGAATRASADFAGASEDGSRVYFTTTAQLSATDKDTGNDLYMASIGCPQDNSGCGAGEREVMSLTQVSHDPNGGSAEVQGVLRVAPDGQRAYFVASGDLLSGAQRQALEGEGRAVPVVGAENLYVYDGAGGGSVSFVGDLCSGTERSGAAEDVRCPGGATDERLWQPEGYESGGESQTAGPSGEFLVFSTYAQLTNDDTNIAKDVYRYDAGTGVISLVSVGEDGYEPSEAGIVPGAGIAEGHRGGRVVEQYEMDNRAISEDGSRIVFTSARPLSPDVTNGLVNAYEWHAGSGGGGSVSLVSTGTDPEGVDDVVISPSGSSVFFVTSQGLVAQDTDGLYDIYDARFGEGFPTGPAERQPCEGDGCQGPLTNPVPLLVAGSVSQAPGEDFSPVPVPVAPAPVKVKVKPKKCKGGYVRGKGGRCVRVRKKAGKAAKAPGLAHKSSRGGRS